jgi:hypothetical protein
LDFWPGLARCGNTEKQTLIAGKLRHIVYFENPVISAPFEKAQHCPADVLDRQDRIWWKMIQDT